MEQQINNFQKGMLQEFDPNKQPENSYFKAVNVVRNDSGEMESEDGTVSFEEFYDDMEHMFHSTNLRLLGHTVLEEDVIVFLGDDTYSELGVWNKSIGYKAYISNNPLTLAGPDTLYGSTTTFVYDLNFSLEHCVSATGRKAYNNDRLIYFTDDFNKPRRVNLDGLDTANPLTFEEALSLVNPVSRPTYEDLSVEQGGSVPTGIYFFFARYLDDTGIRTEVVNYSDSVYVYDEAETADFKDGAPPQTATGKKVSFFIRNLSSLYNKIEVGFITYEGLESSPSTAIFYEGNLAAEQGELLVEYTGVDAILYTIASLTEVTVNSADIKKAKHLLQKDGYLMLFNIEEGESADDDLAFQSVANNISVGFETCDETRSVEGEEGKKKAYLQFKPQVSNAYILNSEITAATPVGGAAAITSSRIQGVERQVHVSPTEYKSFQRGEVYDFSFIPIINGKPGKAYHIPGPGVDWAPADHTSDKLDERIQDAVVVTSVAGTDWVKRTGRLGTYVSENTYPEGKGFPTAASGITINKNDGSGDRTPLDNRVRMHYTPTLNQCPSYFGGRVFEPTDPDPYELWTLGLFVKVSNVVIPAELKAKIDGYMIGFQPRDTSTKGAVLAQGMYQPLIESTAGSGEYVNTHPWGRHHHNLTLGGLTTTSFDGPTKSDFLVLHVPDFRENIEDYRKMAYIRTEIQSRPHSLAGCHEGDSNLNGTFTSTLQGLGNAGFGSVTLDPFISVDDFERYNRINGDVTGSYGVYGTETVLGESNLNLAVRDSIVAKLGSSLTHNYVKGWESSFNFSGLYTLAHVARSSSSEEARIVNLYKPARTLYGNIENAYYYEGGVFDKDDTAPDGIVQGDTFISWYTLLVDYIFANPNLLTKGAASGGRAVCVIAVESKANYKLKHYEEGDLTVPGTMPYFPAYDNIHHWEGDYSIGIPLVHTHPTGYNRQYSRLKDFRRYFSVLDTDAVSDYPDRVRYSNAFAEGITTDTYRVFSILDYHDLPKDKGEITSAFVQGNILYIQTKNSLYRTYTNESQQVLTDVGQLVLGTGGMFPVPSKEMITQDGGYLGSSAQFSGVSTPYGRFMIDESQGKAFLLTERLTEITDQGMYDFFHENMGIVVDTPALGSGYISTFDFKNKRWILTKIGSWTLSYFPLLQSWTAFHDYQPNWYIIHNNELFGYVNGLPSLHIMNEGVQGVYFNADQKGIELHFIVNKYPVIHKVYDNHMVQMSVFDKTNNRYRPDRGFNSISAFNLRQNSFERPLIINNEFGYYPPFGEFLSVFVKDKYNIQIPFDGVVSDEAPTTDNLNSIYSLAPTDDRRAYRPRIKGNYSEHVLRYTPVNSEDLKFVISYISTIFRQNAR